MPQRFMDLNYFVWSALSAVCTTFVILLPDVRTFAWMVLKVAWLYMVAGARG